MFLTQIKLEKFIKNWGMMAKMFQHLEKQKNTWLTLYTIKC